MPPVTIHVFYVSAISIASKCIQLVVQNVCPSKAAQRGSSHNCQLFCTMMFNKHIVMCPDAFGVHRCATIPIRFDPNTTLNVEFL